MRLQYRLGRRTRLLGFAAVGAFVATLGWSQTAMGHLQAGSKANDNLAYVKAQIAQATAVPKFVAPGPAFDASPAKGKKIFLIPQVSSVPFLKAIDDSILKLGKQLGVKVTEFPNQGQSAQWVQGINQAIAQKVDAIILGAPPEVLQPQLAQAKKAGIPVISLHLYDKTMPRAKGISATVFAPFTRAARLEADWAILGTKGKANAVIVTSNEVPPSKYIVKAMQAEFKQRCPTCKTTVIDVPAADWGTKMQTAVQSALVKDSGVNYVIPLYDSATQFVLPGIEAAGRTGKVKVASYNGTPFVLKAIKDKTVAMDVGESQDWLGHASFDQALRLITGHKPLANAETPIRVFTAANIKSAGNPPDPNRAFGNTYVSGYAKLWSGK
jgi:ribose transport system substrate-binding protein